jgi:hypothetical protein
MQEQQTMSLVHCIFKNCFTVDDGSSHRQPFTVEDCSEPALLQHSDENREINGMNSNDIPPSLQLSEDSATTRPADHEDAESDIIQRSTSPIQRMHQQFCQMVQNVFKNIEEGFNSDAGDQFDGISQRTLDEKIDKDLDDEKSLASPLSIATVYKSMNDIPSIDLEQVVLPGSSLQRQMSLRLQSKGILTESAVDECVICMEPFDDFNPRIPTRCGCGDNRTLFHLPCMYQWLEKCRECPTCRQVLKWEEL